MNYKEYVVENTENQRILIITDIHNCHIEWCRTSNQDRMELMCDALSEEYEKAPYDCILSLGDYSLDFWKWDIGGSYLFDPPVSRTDEFMKKYCSRFPKKAYLIPGNHEQYGNEKWNEITGFDREFSVIYGNYVFVMLDTFAGELDPTENSDGVYTGINTYLLKEVLQNHPDKKIILCAHHLDLEAESAEVKELIEKEERIVCAFAGHIHNTLTVLSDEISRHFPIIFCGNFSYHPASEKKGQWGYRFVNFDEKKITTDYILVK